MRANGFCDLALSKVFARIGFLVYSVHWTASSINQNSIVHIELLIIFNIEYTSSMLDYVMDIVDVVVYCSRSVALSFCNWSRKFVVFMEVYSAWIKAIASSAKAEL